MHNTQNNDIIYFSKEKIEASKTEVTAEFPAEIKISRYLHFKGNEYEVTGFAKHSETGEKLVIYRLAQNPNDVWARPYDMFAETITLNGKQVKRFTPLS